MFLKRVKITNGFQHKSLDFEFGNFTAIVGPNGCGKSNFVELLAEAMGLKFALPGTKDSMITEGEEKGKVELFTEVDGDDVLLSSALGKSNRSVKRGDMKISKAADVLEYVRSNVLKTDFDVVNQTSIIRQRDFTKGLFDSPAVRMASFMRLAGLTEIEKKRDELMDEKALHTPPMMAFNVEEAEREVQDLKHAIDSKEEDMRLLNDSLVEDEYKRMKSIVDNVDKSVELSAELSTARTQVDELTGTLDESVSAASSLEKDYQEVRSIVDEAAPQYKEAIASKAAAAQHNSILENKRKYEQELREAKNELVALRPVPEEFDQESKLSECLEISVEVEHEVRKLEDSSDLLTGKAECPTCHQHIEGGGESIIRQNDKKLMELDLLRKEAERSLEAVREAKAEWIANRAHYDTELSRLNAEVKEKQALLESTGDVSGDPIDVDGLDEIIRIYDDAAKAEREISAKKDSVDKLITDTKAALAAAKAQVREIEKQLPKSESITDIDSMREYIAAHEEAEKQIHEWRGEVKQLHDRIQAENKRIADMEEQADRVRKLSLYTSTLEFARTALKRDNYPAGKVTMFVDRVLTFANSYLETLDAGFSITFNTKEGFIQHKHSTGVSIRADRMSGGEQVTFAIAFRFAVNQVRSETGFIILDEPTNHLDDNHVDKVAELLSVVKDKLAKDVQVIVVTHSDKLASIADKKLEL